MTLKYIWRSFSLGCHFHMHFSYPWHAFASHGLPAIAELLVLFCFVVIRFFGFTRSSHITGKRPKIGPPLAAEKPEGFQLQGGFAPPDQGLCPWTPLGAMPPDPHYRRALTALAMVYSSATSRILLLPLLTHAWFRVAAKYNFFQGVIMSTFIRQRQIHTQKKTHAHYTQTHAAKWFYILSHARYCIGQTISSFYSQTGGQPRTSGQQPYGPSWSYSHIWSSVQNTAVDFPPINHRLRSSDASLTSDVVLEAIALIASRHLEAVFCCLVLTSAARAFCLSLASFLTSAP